MNSQPWVVAAGISGLPVELWAGFMGMWIEWAKIVAEGTAQATEILNKPD